MSLPLNTLSGNRAGPVAAVSGAALQCLSRLKLAPRVAVDTSADGECSSCERRTPSLVDDQQNVTRTCCTVPHAHVSVVDAAPNDQKPPPTLRVQKQNTTKCSSGGRGLVCVCVVRLRNGTPKKTAWFCADGSSPLGDVAAEACTALVAACLRRVAGFYRGRRPANGSLNDVTIGAVLCGGGLGNGGHLAFSFASPSAFV